jgi:translation elongation factor P/translation initiation factor 5A
MDVSEGSFFHTPGHKMICIPILMESIHIGSDSQISVRILRVGQYIMHSSEPCMITNIEHTRQGMPRRCRLQIALVGRASKKPYKAVFAENESLTVVPEIIESWRLIFIDGRTATLLDEVCNEKTLELTEEECKSLYAYMDEDVYVRVSTVAGHVEYKLP